MTKTKLFKFNSVLANGSSGVIKKAKKNIAVEKVYVGESSRKDWLIDNKHEINKILEHLKSTKTHKTFLSICLIILSSIFILMLAFFDHERVYSFYDAQIMQIVSPIILMVMGVITLILSRLTSNTKESILKQELISIDDELELLNLTDVEYEQRAELQFKQHQKELKRYYDINIGHLKFIFPIGIVIIVVGLVIIFSVIFIFKDNAQQNIFPIIAGCVSGLLVDFIGAIFIKMYIETVKASTEFHNKLIKSNSHLFANVLITKINDNKMKNEALAEVAKIISADRYQ